MKIEVIDSTINTDEVLLWQYNNATNLQAIIENRKTWIDKNFKQFFNDFYKDVFNLDTANDFGLSVWAVILGVVFNQPVIAPTKWFGFTNSNGVNFNQGVFYPKTGLILTTEEKRTILQLRYLYMTTNATLDDIIKAIQVIIPNLNILDNLNMSVILTSAAMVSLRLVHIIDTFKIIPLPAGVKMEKRLGYGTWLNFTGSSGTNLNNGNFGG